MTRAVEPSATSSNELPSGLTPLAVPSGADPQGSPTPDAEPTRWLDSQALAAEAWRPEIERLIGRLPVEPGDVVLDAGCGTGHITRWLAERAAPGGQVVGVDIEEEAVAGAAWALQDLEGQGTDLELWTTHLEHLPFDDDQFDAAWCSSVLGYLEDPLAGLRELVRVVRPGGRVLALTGDAARWTFWPIGVELESRLRAAERQLVANQRRESPVDLHLGRHLYALARQLPVTDVDAESVVWERTAPLNGFERRFLRRSVAWLTDPSSRPLLGDDWDACRRLFDPASDEDILQRPDLHVIQTASVVVLTV